MENFEILLQLTLSESFGFGWRDIREYLISQDNFILVNFHYQDNSDYPHEWLEKAVKLINVQSC